MDGSLVEIRSLRKEAREIIMDVPCHNITPRVLPHYHKWIPQYGETFFYWFGLQPRICITNPDMVKQVLSNKFGFYTKDKPRPAIAALLGKGLVLTNGTDWVRHRRVVSPAFTMDKLKVMTKRMGSCALSMLDSWQDLVMRSAKCEYLPTKWNRHKWEVERKATSTLRRIIQARLDSKESGYGNDLLGLMMESSTNTRGGLALSMDEIISECKTFFFVGHETTANLLTWAMFLLGSNQDWQERLREEVLRECGTEAPNADALSKLKLVTMVLLEALRLYCPVIMMTRRTSMDMKLGEITVPKDVLVTIPLIVIHRSEKYWGADACEFNPYRFADGIAKAGNHPNALMAFSMGPRVCVGQNFAMMEAKTVLVMILQRFSFSLSPQYKHAPVDMLTLHPQFGMPVTVVVMTLVIVLLLLLWNFFAVLLWRPYQLTKFFNRQGIRGPRYAFMGGSLVEIKNLKKAASQTTMDAKCHNITPRILPHYHKWIPQYGETFLYWFGLQPRICITDLEMVKQVLSNKFGFFTK
ncbi:hypothetical protein QJS10_CPA05g00061 [Acorus calamus]|uniref:Cytochrome P450 n=1 Tax=Acorus calamus TaxID=4465 RepID=A0AAV9EVZ0_ACOCL|nr:hypothetical protein QJS10_CPA05g00061 [Acorus calamus]